MAIPLDLDCYPIVLQGFPRGRKSEADLLELFAKMSVVGQRAARNHTVHVVIAVGDDDFNAAERGVIASCMAAAPAEEAACVVGAFAVIENTFARGVLTALKWLAPHSIPVVPAASPDEAISLAAARLVAAGVKLDTAIKDRAHVHARRLHAESKGLRGERGSVR
jgi:hypothetical protein